MRVANSFQIGVGSGSVGRLPRPTSFEQHQKCTRVRAEVVMQLKNNGGGNYTLTNADAVDIFLKTFGSITMGFGEKATDIVDDSLPADRYREMCVMLSGRDFIFQGAFLKDYSNVSANAVTINAGATGNITFELIRPFIYERVGARLDEWCPGATQMNQLQFSFVRGGAFTANAGNIVQNAAADVTILFDTESADTDNWSNCPRLYRNEESGLVQYGPAGGGGLLGMWDYNAAGAATGQGIISLERDGDAPLHWQVQASRISRDSQLLVPQGSFDLNTLATVLYQPEESAKLEDIVTSHKFKLTQATNALAPMKTAWLYVPTVTETYRDAVVGPNVVGSGKNEAKLVVKPALEGQDPQGHTAAISSTAIVTPEHPRYQLLPGRLFLKDQPPSTHIPAAVVNGVKAAAAGGGDAATSRLAQEAKAVAKFVPGARSPMRGAQTAHMGEIADTLAPSAAARASLRSFLGRVR